MRATRHRRGTTVRAQRAGRGTFVVLCLLAALLLNLPYARPGRGDMRDMLVLSLVAVGIVSALPGLWRWRARFKSPTVRVVAGVAAMAAWIAGMGAAMGTVLFLTSPVGFMDSRTLTHIVHSRDGHATFYGYRRNFWGAGGLGELALGVGPFEILVVKQTGDGSDTFDMQLRDLRAWGHRFQWGEGQDVRIDGEPATVDWRD